MATLKNPTQKILDAAGKFVTKQKGVWEHADWENFVAEAQKLGMEVNDETRRYLGNVLEAAKSFYHGALAGPDSAKASKPKPKSKPKAKDKPKDKAKEG